MKRLFLAGVLALASGAFVYGQSSGQAGSQSAPRKGGDSSSTHVPESGTTSGAEGAAGTAGVSGTGATASDTAAGTQSADRMSKTHRKSRRQHSKTKTQPNSTGNSGSKTTP